MKVMQLNNRAMLVLRPRWAFLRWVKRTTGDAPMGIDLGIYLIPAYDSPDEGYAFLETNYRQILENEFACWCTDRRLWPEDRSFKAFCKYFRYEIDDPVFDLGAGKPRRVAFDPTGF